MGQEGSPLSVGSPKAERLEGWVSLCPHCSQSCAFGPSSSVLSSLWSGKCSAAQGLQPKSLNGTDSEQQD